MTDNKRPIELPRRAYQQIDRLARLAMYYDGFNREVHAICSQNIRGEIVVDRKSLLEELVKIMNAYHEIVVLLDNTPYDLLIEDE